MGKQAKKHEIALAINKQINNNKIYELYNLVDVFNFVPSIKSTP